MTTVAKPQIRGNFNWDFPKIVPAFVEGEDAKALYEAVAETLEGNFSYEDNTRTLWGSSLPLAARIDSIVRPLGIRVATLADLSKEEVMSKVRGSFYSDTSTIVMRSISDSYEPNTEIIPGLVVHVEQKQGVLRLPVLVTGFDVVRADNRYGWEIEPREDFNVLEDERLSGKYDGMTFTGIDELGLPEFDKRGSRTWYARDQGLSRLFLSGSLVLNSGGGDLASSDEYGRVVLVSGEAANAKFLGDMPRGKT